jgi:hypothetical protein
MPLQLPNLDDHGYNDLMAEALALIPTFSPEWTNYNPSDPGITLVELFAYLTDMLLYRLNRVSDENTRKFLKLLNGPDWVEPQNADLREEVGQAVLTIRERYRAVTKDDYEFLSTESFNQWLQTSQSMVAPVARAHCVPQRNLDANGETERLMPRPEHVSVVIVPANADSMTNPNPQPSPDQINALFSFLDARRMLTTKLHVTGPFYVHVIVDLVVARKPDVSSEDELCKAITQALSDFLNPMPSEKGEGWPFGRDVFVSDIYDLVEQVPGVDFITDITLDSSCAQGDDKCIVAEPIWHEDGDLVGLRIQPHHLPILQTVLDSSGIPEGIVVAPNSAFSARIAALPTPIPAFVIVNLTVTTKATADPTSLKQAIKSIVRKLFHPALGGPSPSASLPTDIALADVTAALKKIAGISDPVQVDAKCIPDAALMGKNPSQFVHVEAGQIVDWRVQIDLS